MSKLDTRERLTPAAAAKAAPATQSLYATRQKVYPKQVSGTVRRAKWALLILCLGLYYTVPLIRWDRGPALPDQAVLVDMEHARLFFFWFEIWPQEVYYLTGLLVLAAAAAIGEEVLFRGVLLPRMAGVFGRWDWVANTVLFGLYHVHKIWFWPSMITSSFGNAWAAKRYRSLWMGVIVHGAEGYFVVLVLGVILGWYP